jgi:SRSO17 transposase
LSIATSHAHVPIDFELYLPRSWTDVPERRLEAKLPESIAFRSKEELALAMIERAAREKIPGSIVLADSWYGRSSTFRDTVQLLGFDYALGILGSQTMWQLNDRDRVTDRARSSAEQIATALPARRYRQWTWRRGVSFGRRGVLRSRFAFVRVGVPSDASVEDVAKLWLLIEWPEGEVRPTRYALTTLPRRMPKKEIVRLFKERYRTERVYEEMKVELGLDHFEGRSFRGWHHHVSVAVACYAFVVAEQASAFPPSGARTCRTHSFAPAA